MEAPCLAFCRIGVIVDYGKEVEFVQEGVCEGFSRLAVQLSRYLFRYFVFGYCKDCFKGKVGVVGDRFLCSLRIPPDEEIPGFGYDPAFFVFVGGVSVYGVLHRYDVYFVA